MSKIVLRNSKIESGSKCLFNKIVYDADALSYITNVENSDEEDLEINVKRALNNFVIGCKQDGIWASIVGSLILGVSRKLQSALIPLKGPSITAYNFVSSDYVRKQGLKGNGINSYISLNRNNNEDPQNSKHFSVFITQKSNWANTFNRYYLGGTTTNGNSFLRLVSETQAQARINSASSASPTTPATNVEGFFCVNRNNSTSHTLRVANQTLNFNINSATPANAALNLFADRDAISPNNFADGRIFFYSSGLDLIDPVLLENRVTTLKNSI
jgi:hypothetical protein